MGRKPQQYPEPGPVPVERRQEDRRVTTGSGWMEPLEGGAGEEFQLVDVSPKGFRALHRCFTLAAGQKVHFRFARRKGVAVTMWNRVLKGHVESGFLIVSGSL